ncbi:hypothetical protein ANN_17782 [Periplaneta americana]|uniref:HTH CENPB-type domain-containing protein n=1 Tax=Periplaneta americana TaxID=6978 RepID=A0ABQ8SU27_PERAM|nr:hypothetical protein ANN_17782 [Periplaneta americana]
MRSKGNPISGPVLQAKALDFHKIFQDDEETFTASVGWLIRWKKRYGIRQLSIGDEKLAGTNNVIVELVHSEDCDESDNKSDNEGIERISHTPGIRAIEAALAYIEQQEESTVYDFLQLRRWHTIAVSKRGNKLKQQTIQDFFFFAKKV